jgi:hypothetical protein
VALDTSNLKFDDIYSSFYICLGCCQSRNVAYFSEKEKDDKTNFDNFCLKTLQA